MHSRIQVLHEYSHLLSILSSSHSIAMVFQRAKNYRTLRAHCLKLCHLFTEMLKCRNLTHTKNCWYSNLFIVMYNYEN